MYYVKPFWYYSSLLFYPGLSVITNLYTINFLQWKRGLRKPVGWVGIKPRGASWFSGELVWELLARWWGAMGGPSQGCTSAGCLQDWYDQCLGSWHWHAVKGSQPVLAAAGIKMTRVPLSFGVEISLKRKINRRLTQVKLTSCRLRQ